MAKGNQGNKRNNQGIGDGDGNNQGKSLQMVCRLSGFHTLMSFLGSIGNLMNGSGLEEVFEEVYSKDTFKDVLFKDVFILSQYLR